MQNRLFTFLMELFTGFLCSLFALCKDSVFEVTAFKLSLNYTLVDPSSVFTAHFT